MPMSGVKDCPCLVVESPEPTEDRAGTTSPVPMSGTKDRPSLVEDCPAVPKVHNLCWGGGNSVKGGSVTLPINLVSPPTTTSTTEDPQPRVLPSCGGDPEVATGSEPDFASHPRTQSNVVVHESPQYIVVDESPSPPPQPNTVGPALSLPPTRQPAYIEHVKGIPYLIRPSRDRGSGGGGHSSSGGALAPVAARATSPSRPAGGLSGPSVAEGAAGGGGGGSSPPCGGGGPSFRHSGGPAQARGEDE